MQRVPAKKVLLLILFLLIQSCSRLRPPPSALDRLKPCMNAEGPTDAYCGKLDVWENRATRTGRKIALKVVVLPGLRRDAAADPLFFLAGGPGQGAAKMTKQVREIFRNLQIDRDLVLVDQRGTGDSNPLDCKHDDDKLDQSPQAALDRMRNCLTTDQTKADVRLYTTTIAMDDLDDVRRFLGYEKINLYGGSYGTRAAIVYARKYAPYVRSVILDGVAPPDMRLPLYMARDGQRALGLLLRDCDQDPGCRQRFPAIGERLTRLLARLGAQPHHVRLIHPRTGAETEIDVKPLMISGALFGALYSPQTAALLPLLIERAEKNDFQGFFALGSLGDGLATNMAEAMHFSVVCSEDAPRIILGSIQREAANTFIGAEMAEWRMKTCDFWPRGDVDKGYYDSPQVDIPALILSGELDPVTPPSWGQQVASHWTNSRHIVVPGIGHGTIGSGCVLKILREFVNQGSATNLNIDCVQRVRRPPFFLGPSGPDPQGATKQ
jgi:pimeloyl-ACP methyl ester carboxylesterase